MKKAARKIPRQISKSIPLGQSRDLRGLKFGRLTVLEIADKRRRSALWLCQCDCGSSTKIIFGNSLKRGLTKSCGCLHHEVMITRGTHRMAKTKLYKAWSAMKERCSNQKHRAWRYYGGRGIRVCERWQTFENFLADMGERPFAKATIERKDMNGNYCPENCRWATQAEQKRNTRQSHFLTYNGLTMCLADWASKMSIPSQTLSYRALQGWTPEECLFGKFYAK